MNMPPSQSQSQAQSHEFHQQFTTLYQQSSDANPPLNRQQLFHLHRQLQALFNQHQDSLIPYDVARYQNLLQTLNQQVSTAPALNDDTQVPKAKFAFSSSRKRQQGTSVNASSPAAAANKQPTASQPNVSSPLTHSPPSLQLTQLFERTIHLSEVHLTRYGRDVDLTDLRDCRVFICGQTQALRISNLQRCHVYCGPTSGSVLLHNNMDCVFSFITSQLRIHTTTNSCFYLYAKSSPIIEHCNGLVFQDRCLLHYASLRQDQQESRLSDQHAPNQALLVQDFNWLRVQASPHWSTIENDAQRQQAQLVTVSDDELLNAGNELVS